MYCSYYCICRYFLKYKCYFQGQKSVTVSKILKADFIVSEMSESRHSALSSDINLL